jgi:hypothetical protein
VRADRARREVEPVGDLTIGQARTGQPDDVPLLGRELPQAITLTGRVCDGHPACSQFCLRPPLPRRRSHPPEGLQGLWKFALGVIDAAVPPQPLGIIEAKLGPLEWPPVARGVGKGLVEMPL